MATAIAPDLAARSRYIEAAERASRGAAADSDARSILEQSVTGLERFLIGALLCEYIHDHGISSIEQLRAQKTAIDQYIHAAFPGATSTEQKIREAVNAGAPSDGAWPTVDWSQLVRSLDAIVAESPIEALEALGRVLEPDLAHRARTAYDALRAFVRRHDPNRAAVMRIVGHQYRLGHLQLGDAARLLGMSTSDTVFELEQDGYSRPVSAITLSEDDREATYQRLRTRRLAGGHTLDPELVERDVIASERIEGVDARAWIRHR